MDVATRTTNVPFSRRVSRRLTSFFSTLTWVLCIVFWASQSPLAAKTEDQPIHFSGDRQLWNRKANVVELFGHAAVSQIGETLTADYIHLDQRKRTLVARGNCVYITAGNITYSEEMNFNLDTRTGTIFGARLATDRYTLRGQKLDKLGEGR